MSVAEPFIASSPELVEKVVAEKLKTGKTETAVLSSFACGRIGRAVTLKEKNLITRKNLVIDSVAKGGGAFRATFGGYADREEFKENMEFLLSYFRDLFLYRAAQNEALIFNRDRSREIKESSRRFSAEALDRLIMGIIKLRSYIDYNVNPKMVMDVLENELRRAGCAK